MGSAVVMSAHGFILHTDVFMSAHGFSCVRADGCEVGMCVCAARGHCSWQGGGEPDRAPLAATKKDPYLPLRASVQAQGGLPTWGTTKEVYPHGAHGSPCVEIITFKPGTCTGVGLPLHTCSGVGLPLHTYMPLPACWKPVRQAVWAYLYTPSPACWKPVRQAVWAYLYTPSPAC